MQPTNKAATSKRRCGACWSLRLPAELQPRPGPKFDYKLAWFERLIAHAAALFATDAPVVIAGDFNVVPTDFDIYPTKSWSTDALVRPESRACFRRLLEQGWTDAIPARHPSEPMFTFWDYKRNRWPRDAGLRLDHLLLNRAAAPLLVAAGVDRKVGGKPVPVIMRRPG
jgi:exodeoxyribonuclease-3